MPYPQPSAEISCRMSEDVVAGFLTPVGSMVVL
jgi:hypothetical protein